MSDDKPSLLDKTMTEAWSKKKCLDELHRHATSGHAEWSVLLLERTKYETLPKFLDPESWKGETTESLRHLETVVEYVLSEAPEHLPAGLDPDRVVANFKQAILKSIGPGPHVA